MGIDAEDVDGDGRTDLFVTNYWYEAVALFNNMGQGLFQDRTPASGLWHDSVLWVGWGCALADFDNDSWPDCFVANGHIDNNLEIIGYDTPYAEPALLHRNVKGRGFRLATRDVGPYFDSDLMSGEGPPMATSTTTVISTWSSVTRTAHRLCSATTLRRTITGSASRSSARSATATRSVRASRSSWAAVRSFDNEKAAQAWNPAHDPRLLIGLGSEPEARKVTVRWPSRRVSVAEHLAADRSYRVVEPRGPKGAVGRSFEFVRDGRNLKYGF